MNVLVTGGLGFIGSNFILDAAKNPDLHQITHIDSLSFGSNPENNKSVALFVGVENHLLTTRIQEGFHSLRNLAEPP